MSRTRLTVIFLPFACVVPRAIVTTTNCDTTARRSTPCDAGNYTLTNVRPCYLIPMDRQNELAQASAGAAHLPHHGPHHGPDHGSDQGPDQGKDHFLAC